MPGSQCGAPGSYTLIGPPLKMMPRGSSAFDALGRQIVPHELAEHIGVAHPAGDQLRDLRAKVEDENPFTFG